MIAKGDTLASIARMFDTSVTELMELNGLSGSALFAGQPLRVPGQTGTVEHAVSGGETLQSLTALYGLSEETLRRSNPPLRDVLADAPLSDGLVVRIPPGEGEIVILQANETVLDVALRYGISPGEFKRVNALADLKTVAAGRALFVPAAFAPVTATVSAPVGTPVDAAARELHLAQQLQLLNQAGALLATYEPAAASFHWPLRGRVSSGYGRRNLSVGGNTFHGGVDLAAAPGTPVGAARAGVVSRSSWGGAYGYVVYVEHSDGSQTRYGHLGQILTSVGTYLSQGETLGLVGSTGASTGPHLHFEIRFDGKTVDPLGYLQ